MGKKSRQKQDRKKFGEPEYKPEKHQERQQKPDNTIRLISAGIIFITVLIYFQTGNFEFINFDDPAYVINNIHIQNGLTLKGIKWAFSSTASSNWHPLTWISHMLDYELFKLDPGWHHLSNMILHILSALLLFRIFFYMTGNLIQSAGVSILFAIHPLHVESVAWISERKDVLSAFFWMVSMGGYAVYVKSGKKNMYLFAIFAYALGLMSKPMIVTLPFVLLLIDIWPLNRIQNNDDSPSMRRQKIRSILIEKIPFLLLTILSCIITIIAQKKGGAISGTDIFPLGIRLENAAISYIMYLKKTFWPLSLCIFYPHPQSIPLWKTAGALIILCTITIITYLKRKKQPYLAVGWLWYLGMLVPVIGIVQVGSQAMADRYTYLPLIGIFIMLSWGISDLFKKWSNRPGGASITVVPFLIFLIVCAVIQVGYWKNSIFLFEHSLKTTERNPVAHTNLGTAYYQSGKFDAALEHFHMAVQLKPDFPTGHFNLANVLDEQKNYTQAVEHYQKALSLSPNYVEAHYNLGNTLIKLNKIAEALYQFRTVYKLKPNDINVKKIILQLEGILKPL